MAELPSCPICLENYSSRGSRAPLSLSCGHSICETCWQDMPDVEKKCPFDRTKFARNYNPPRNFPLLEALDTLARQGAATSAAQAAAAQAQARAAAAVSAAETLTQDLIASSSHVHQPQQTLFPPERVAPPPGSGSASPTPPPASVAPPPGAYGGSPAYGGTPEPVLNPVTFPPPDVGTRFPSMMARNDAPLQPPGMSRPAVPPPAYASMIPPPAMPAYASMIPPPASATGRAPPAAGGLAGGTTRPMLALSPSFSRPAPDSNAEAINWSPTFPQSHSSSLHHAADGNSYKIMLFNLRDPATHQSKVLLVSDATRTIGRALLPRLDLTAIRGFSLTFDAIASGNGELAILLGAAEPTGDCRGTKGGLTPAGPVPSSWKAAYAVTACPSKSMWAFSKCPGVPPPYMMGPGGFIASRPPTVVHSSLHQSFHNDATIQLELRFSRQGSAGEFIMLKNGAPVITCYDPNLAAIWGSGSGLQPVTIEAWSDDQPGFFGARNIKMLVQA